MQIKGKEIFRNIEFGGKRRRTLIPSAYSSRLQRCEDIHGIEAKAFVRRITHTHTHTQTHTQRRARKRK